jgi:GTP-binding protein YchF
MNVALLGLPQAGKRTLFTLLTRRKIPHGRKENESIEGQAAVKDPRVDAISAICKPERTKYAETTYVLCPDIRPDSGREWLDPARRCECLCLVVRAFGDPNVYHPAGAVDPERDRSSLRTDLLLADLDLVERRLERIGKEKRGGQTGEQALEEHTLRRCNAAIGKDQMLADLALDPHELQSIRSLGLLTLKPVMWAYDVDEGQVKNEGTDPFTIACKIEQEIMDLESPEEQSLYLKELGLSSSGVDRMNRAAYDALGLMSFYTMGEDEVRAWTIRKGTLAPAAAGKVHTDIERGFIRAEIVKYDDLMAAGSEAAVRDAGKVQLKGKDYVIQDGDICLFRFSV